MQNKIDHVHQVITQFDQTPRPKSRVPTLVGCMTRPKVGADVGTPHVKPLVHQPKAERPLLGREKEERRAQNTVLQHDRVAAAAWATRV